MTLCYRSFLAWFILFTGCQSPQITERTVELPPGPSLFQPGTTEATSHFEEHLAPPDFSGLDVIAVLPGED